MGYVCREFLALPLGSTLFRYVNNNQSKTGNTIIDNDLIVSNLVVSSVFLYFYDFLFGFKDSSNSYTAKTNWGKSITVSVESDPMQIGYQVNLNGGSWSGKDKVIWPLMYKEIGNDISQLYVSLENKNKAIKDFLMKNGISEDEITVSAPEIIDMKAERYVNENITYRYNATSVLTVSSGKVDLVRKLISEQSDLLKQGIVITSGDYRYQTQFLFTKLNDIKPEMIEEATKNAREAALKFAEDSDSKLGKIRTANQGQFSITDRDANTPYIKNVRVVTTIDYYLND